MLLEIMLFMLLGVLVGVITGLVPGLHPNTVFVLILSASVLFTGMPALYTVVFIVSLSISNVFLDFIPSILFGAPDPDTCLSVLPGHQMLMEGRGYEAVLISTAGGLCAIIVTIITLPVLLFSVPALYSQIHPLIHILLISVVAWMVMTEHGMKKLWAAGIFLLSGLFGLVTLNALSDAALFPALSGLFGLSGLIISLYGKPTLPRQRKTHSINRSVAKGSLAGWLAGMLSGMLPGIGTSQAGMVAGQAFRSKAKEFLAALGGINVANMVFTLVAFYTLGKTRSGAVSAISQLVPSLSFSELILLLAVALLTAFVSVILTVKIAGVTVLNLQKISYKNANMSIIAFLVLAIAALSGPLGLLISITATLIGVVAVKLGVKRSHMMGFLIFPTTLYFSGHLAIVSGMLGL